MELVITIHKDKGETVYNWEDLDGKIAATDNLEQLLMWIRNDLEELEYGY